MALRSGRSFSLLVLACALLVIKTNAFHLNSPGQRQTDLAKLSQAISTTAKPSRVEIEKAAGQGDKQPTKSSNDPGLAGVSGQQTDPKAECKCYTNCPLLTHNPEVRDRLAKLTETRNYPMFVAEKAAKYLIDDVWGNMGDSVAAKERLVILGAGWGAAAVLKGIDTNRYDVTVISPRNYFLFTPMLAGSAVGTVNVRSITQPIRDFNANANYLEAAAKEINPEKQIIKCTGLTVQDNSEIDEFEVPYDRLIVSVGARVNTFGIKGVEEYCSYLKQVDHARKIRRKIVSLFERANLPGTPEEEIEKLLSFAIIGAGPTGVEFAGELRDYVEEEGPKYYPHLLKHVRIKLIEATPVVLRPFDKTLQDAAVEALTIKPSGNSAHLFSEEIAELVVNKKVMEVSQDFIKLEDGRDIPYGLAVWAGGIGPLEITLDLIARIGGRQVINQNVARGKLAVDPWHRVIDAKGKIFAIGDCAANQGGPLPATAQVAAQQGEFLAHILNVGNHTIGFENGVQLPPKKVLGQTQLADSIAALSTGEDEYLAPFQYLDLGVLAYTGRFSALAQLQMAPTEAGRVKAKGKVGFGLWRSIYLIKQTSLRNQMLVFLDWCKARMFGRDITLID
ncbi:Internal alternative NAD(P)H-ubiquinone oxidoreductase A1, mitochondrial [Seminavis robusta]|uniref:NADH:ubiquinone reductase (non-electrogenic) n=1 Tax=Seminavis robusta TaxID=568900 RepID=A0A9N8E2X7_9STRA|nr:Internal alternative NAD(P)H-ubiquinone oxidoreductase A1, mitochondrial [Seminavis robusta]|eukprot:Sro602_g173660.1 Internal alternative NAD(P)H-ubiquinone oxidoreductase A1, mitochondrial (619) ;mRNA; r:9250-11537